MQNLFVVLWRHPRRTGFFVFNAVAITALVAWGAGTASLSTQGLAAVPNVMLGYLGMALMLAALLVGWVAWGIMVMTRHRPPKA